MGRYDQGGRLQYTGRTTTLPQAAGRAVARQHAELDRETDPEGEDLRTASVGPLTVVYWINRTGQRLHVIDIVWLG